MAAVAAFLTTLGGLDLSGIITLLPESVAQAFAIAFPSLAGVVHLLRALGDFADDGKINGSFLPLVAMLCALALLLPSCSVTTAPDRTQTRRVDQEAVNPWLELARDLFVPRPEEDDPALPEISPTK